MLTLKEAAALLGVHPATLYRWIKKKSVRVWRPNGRARITRAEVDRILGMTNARS